MTQFSDDRGAEMRELFFETTQELLQTLNEDALRLEKAPQEKEVVRSIRRTVHTLKGDAAACGFRELSDLAHMMEDARTITPSLELLLVSRNLERVADLATNIGEDAVFLAEGKQIKHNAEGPQSRGPKIEVEPAPR